MRKRGQVYILVALVIIVALYGLFAVTNKFTQKSVDSDFEEISDNYARESVRFLNELLSKQDPSLKFKDKFINFTVDFTTYTQLKNPDYGLVYAFKKGDSLYVGNFLTESLILECGCGVGKCNSCDVNYAGKKDIVLEGCYSKIQSEIGLDAFSFAMATPKVDMAQLKDCIKTISNAGDINQVYMSAGVTTYAFDVSANKPELAIVSREEKDEQKKVFVGGKMAPPKKSLTQKSPFTKYCAKKFGGCDTKYCLSVGSSCLVKCSALYKTQVNCKDPMCKWNKNTKACQLRKSIKGGKS